MTDIVWVDPTNIGRKATEVTEDSGIEAKTPWNPTGDVVDLARAGLAARKRRQAGQDPPEGEVGSAWDRYRIYAYYQDGDIFEQGPIETADYEQMIGRDGIGRALEQVLTLPMRSIDWQIKPGAGDNGECKFVTEALTTPPEMGGMEIPMQTIIGQMTSAVLYKRAHFEKVFKVADGKVTYDKIAFRPPTTCYLARSAKDASFQGFMQWTWAGLRFIKVVIPANKAFVYLHGAHRNPLEGISDLDVAYNAWQSKQKLRFLWYQFLETQASPKTIATDSATDETRAAELAQKVAKLKGGGVVGILAGQSVSVLESNGTGAQEFSAAMAYLDQEMLQSVLAGFLGLTSQARGSSGSGQSRGSNALSQDQSEFYNQSRQAVLKEMGAQFTWSVIRDLVTYNFGVGASCPILEFGDLAEQGAAKDAFALLTGIASSATPTPLLPFGFIDQLIEKVATYLDLNIDVVAAAITGQSHSASETPGDVAAAQAQSLASTPLHTAINNAAALVATHGAANGAVPSNGRQPTPA